MKEILIVDDSKFMRHWLKSMVEQHGFHVVAEADDGQDAIELYKIHHPNIVLLDITMEKMDGLSALKEILNHDSQAKVIMCSSLGSQNIIIEALNIGATDFIVKPYFKKLIETIEKVEFNQARAN